MVLITMPMFQTQLFCLCYVKGYSEVCHKPPWKTTVGLAVWLSETSACVKPVFSCGRIAGCVCGQRLAQGSALE